jgi:hypothetical protein
MLPNEFRPFGKNVPKALPHPWPLDNMPQTAHKPELAIRGQGFTAFSRPECQFKEVDGACKDFAQR